MQTIPYGPAVKTRTTGHFQRETGGGPAACCFAAARTRDLYRLKASCRVAPLSRSALKAGSAWAFAHAGLNCSDPSLCDADCLCSKWRHAQKILVLTLESNHQLEVDWTDAVFRPVSAQPVHAPRASGGKRS